MPNTYIVTGGAGFIGSHVVDLLIARGHKVHVIDDLSAGKKEFVNAAAEFHEMDIRSAEIPELFAKIAPTHVIHLAAHIDLRASIQAPSHDADINIMGGLNILEASMNVGAKHLTFASSAGVYGELEKVPSEEEDPTVPVTPYTTAKYAFERYLEAARENQRFASATLRLANTYGPRQTTDGEAGVVAVFIDTIASGEIPAINGTGEQTRDMMYVSDTAAGIVAASEKEFDGVTNVSTGRETSVNQIFQAICGEYGVNFAARSGSSADVGVARSILATERAASVLDWKAEVGIMDGIRETVAWFNEWRKNKNA